MSRHGATRSPHTGPDWDPREDDGYARDDPLFRKLVAALKGHKLEDEAISPLHVWLLSVRSQVRIDLEFEQAVGIKTLAEQRKACGEIEDAAKVLAKRLDFLIQLLPLDDVLFQSFASERFPEVGSVPTTPSRTRRAWHAYRERLHADALTLAAIAHDARISLKEKPATQGAPAKAQRDALFCELVDRVARLARITSENNSVKLALKVWKSCFPEPSAALSTSDAKAARRIAIVAKAMKIASHEAAMKIRQRTAGRNSRK